MSAMTRRALIVVEAVLVGAFLADAAFDLTETSAAFDLLLAAGFAAALAWDLRR